MADGSLEKLARLRPNKAHARKLFIEPADHGLVQLVRYGVVAVIAFAVDFGLLFVFTSKFHLFYVLSATLSFAISVVVNYLLSVSWAFGARTERERTTEIGLFIGICVVALGLNDVFIWAFTSLFGIYYLYSKLLTVVIVFFWSFGARRFVFHSETFKRWLKI